VTSQAANVTRPASKATPVTIKIQRGRGNTLSYSHKGNVYHVAFQAACRPASEEEAEKRVEFGDYVLAVWRNGLKHLIGGFRSQIVHYRRGSTAFGCIGVFEAGSSDLVPANHCQNLWQLRSSRRRSIGL
jgi:hypothetical protein